MSKVAEKQQKLSAETKARAAAYVDSAYPAEEKAERKKNLAFLDQIGLPHRHIEGWRYTPLRWLENLDLSEQSITAAEAPVDIESLLVQLKADCRIDFTNGQRSVDENAIPTGIALKKYTLEQPDHQFIDGFDVLNAALATDGLNIHVAANQTSKTLLCVYGQPGEQRAYSGYRNSISVDDGSELLLIDVYLGDAALNDIGLDIELGKNAKLKRVRLQLLPDNLRQVERVLVKQAANSDFQQCSFDLGSLLCRAETAVKLQESGATCTLNGLFFPIGDSYQDQHTCIEHLAENCVSREHYRGIANGKGRGVFNGRVLVERGAQKTDSAQEIHTLLLSNQAEINAKPELEIYADDVKCAHGATAGQLDEAAAFYLASRGIDRETAHRLLLWSFLQPVMAILPQETIVTALTEMLQNFLPSLLSSDSGDQ